MESKHIDSHIHSYINMLSKIRFADKFYLPHSILNPFLISKPIAQASLTGTALPTCLYYCPMLPQNCQLSGKLWQRAFSLTVKGLASSGRQRSVCFWLGEISTVKDGSSRLSLRKMPVRPAVQAQIFFSLLPNMRFPDWMDSPTGYLSTAAYRRVLLETET